MAEMLETQVHPWVGKVPGEGNGNPLQYSCLENFMERGASWAIVRHDYIYVCVCVCVCMCMNHFVVYLKLAQHC